MNFPFPHFAKIRAPRSAQRFPVWGIRNRCIISIAAPVASSPFNSQTINHQPLARVTYTGGYVLPGDTAAPSQTALPADLENAAGEQVAAWLLRRDMTGLDANWPKGGIMQRFSKLDLLLPVQTVLERYTRVSI